MLVPAFAVDRTELVLLALRRLREAGVIGGCRRVAPLGGPAARMGAGTPPRAGVGAGVGTEVRTVSRTQE